MATETTAPKNTKRIAWLIALLIILIGIIVFATGRNNAPAPTTKTTPSPETAKQEPTAPKVAGTSTTTPDTPEVSTGTDAPGTFIAQAARAQTAPNNTPAAPAPAPVAPEQPQTPTDPACTPAAPVNTGEGWEYALPIIVVQQGGASEMFTLWTADCQARHWYSLNEGITASDSTLPDKPGYHDVYLVAPAFAINGPYISNHIDFYVKASETAPVGVVDDSLLPFPYGFVATDEHSNPIEFMPVQIEVQGETTETPPEETPETPCCHEACETPSETCTDLLPAA